MVQAWQEKETDNNKNVEEIKSYSDSVLRYLVIENMTLDEQEDNLPTHIATTTQPTILLVLESTTTFNYGI